MSGPPITEFVVVNVALQGGAADKFSFGALQGVFNTTDTSARQFGPFTSAAEVASASLGSAAAEAWATAVFAQDTGVDLVYIGREDAADLTWTDTMDAIEADPDTDDWYITNIESRLDADVSAVAAWTEARTKIFIPQTSSSALLAGTGGNIGETLKNANYNRTALIYHAADGEFLDGAWASRCGGFDLDAPAPSGAGTWTNKQLQGVPFDPVSAAQATNIYDENANLFGRTKSVNSTSKGTMASGASATPRFIDVTTTIDWFVTRLQERIFSTMVSIPTKIPYTNAGINLIVADIVSVYKTGVAAAHFRDQTLELTVPDVNQVSSQDIQNRVLELSVGATLASGIHKVVIQLNLQF